MSIGTFSYPMPVNEPILNYAPGSAEKKRLKEVLAELKSSEIDVPMYIGGKEVKGILIKRFFPKLFSKIIKKAKVV